MLGIAVVLCFAFFVEPLWQLGSYKWLVTAILIALVWYASFFRERWIPVVQGWRAKHAMTSMDIGPLVAPAQDKLKQSAHKQDDPSTARTGETLSTEAAKPSHLAEELLRLEFYDTFPGGFPAGIRALARNVGYATLSGFSVELLLLERREPNLCKFVLEYEPSSTFVISQAFSVNPGGDALDIAITDGNRLIKSIDGTSIDVNDLAYRHMVLRLRADGMERKEEVYFYCGGGEKTTLCGPPDGREGALAPHVQAEAKDNRPKPDDWRHLRGDFESHRIPMPLAADYTKEGDSDHGWRFRGYDSSGFEAIARRAGNLVRRSEYCQSALAKQILEHDAVRIWLESIRALTGRFLKESGLVWSESEDGTKFYYELGSIGDVYDASALLCLELESRDGA